MVVQYLVRRSFNDIFPFLTAIRNQADRERDALGFLPEPAYAEALRQRKLILLLASADGDISYAGHLLFGGIYPTFKVMQISIADGHRNRGNATTLLRPLIAQGEKENYLNVIANVASDLVAANSFYEKNGFVTARLKSGGVTRNRQINVRVLQLETPSLISLMVNQRQPKTIDIQPRKRSLEAPIYVIDLNVFFDAIRTRTRSEYAGALIRAAFNHQIRIAISQEFEIELRRSSYDPTNDPILSLARTIPTLPKQEQTTLDELTPAIATAVFPERASNARLSATDKSDVLHLAGAIAAGAAGYITSDEKVLSARDELINKFGLDIIGLSEFAELLDTQGDTAEIQIAKQTRHFQVQVLGAKDTAKFIEQQGIITEPFLSATDLSTSRCRSISDGDGIIGIGLLKIEAAIEQPSRSIVCVRQEHPFSATVADFLISEQIRHCSSNNACHLSLLDTRPRRAIAMGSLPAPKSRRWFGEAASRNSL